MSSSTLRRYIPRPDRPVVAIRLAFEQDGFTLGFRKWGGDQKAKAGDWLVDNNGDIYTVDAAVFARTYRAVQKECPGLYLKTTSIWAERADRAGVVATKEGSTHYAAGDYLVSNSEDDSDRYAISAEQFERLYMPAEEH